MIFLETFYINIIKKHSYRICYSLIYFIFIFSQICSAQDIIATKKHLNPKSVIKPEGFPSIGKWMLNEKLKPANWLKHKYKGKLLQEPINIIIIDSLAYSAEDAIARLIKSCYDAGFLIRSGHSAEYRGYIAGNFYKQLPTGIGHAFSDAAFDTNNNHGRIFGPYFSKNKYYFIGAFSREEFIGDSHKYNSFIKARNNFAQKMAENTNFKIEGKIDIGNMIVNNPKLTSGDHDGYAIILQSKD